VSTVKIKKDALMPKEEHGFCQDLPYPTGISAIILEEIT
jgi:hypothetical protein